MPLVATPFLALLASTLALAPRLAANPPCAPDSSWEEPAPVTAPADATLSPDEIQKRIAVCEAKRNAPLGPSEPAPRADSLHSSRHKGRIVWPTVLYKGNAANLGSVRYTLVMLETIIDRQGCVRSPKILRGTRSEASAAALEALRHYVFHPATLDGKPVSVRYVLTINFD